MPKIPCWDPSPPCFFRKAKYACALLSLIVPLSLFRDKPCVAPKETEGRDVVPQAMALPKGNVPVVKEAGSAEGNVPSSQWVLRLDPDTDFTQVESSVGARHIRGLRGLPGYSLFEIPGTEDKIAAARVLRSLLQIPGVKSVRQEILRPRFSRSHPEPPDFTDPLFPSQWHLYSTHQTPSSVTTQLDLGLTGAWAEGYRGNGIHVAIVDDGMEITHPELSPNYDPDNSYDFIDDDTNPTPLFSNRFHGTAVSGLVAARDNGSLGVGVAPRASIAGLRLIGSSIPDSLEAETILHNKETLQIYNNSWGPSDTDSQVYEGPGPLFLEALQAGVNEGRGGLGSLYVWAAGNGGENQDNSNYDGYANLPWTIAVAGMAIDGSAPDYAEPGANILVCAPGENIITTDLVGSRGDSRLDYTTSFGGSSAATAMVSGVVALVLEANPLLGWRDVQHILVQTCRQNDPSDPGWQYNAAGFPVHHNFGFGLVDASAAANLAKTWQNLPPANTTTLQKSLGTIPGSQTLKSTLSSTASGFVEHVQVTLILEDYDWGELNVSLLSASGTKSILAAPFSSGLGPEASTNLPSNQREWSFMTVRNWAEPASGDWTLSIGNQSPAHTGKVVSWKLTLHTTSDPGHKLPVLSAKGETWNIVNLGGSAQAIDVLLNETLPEGGKPDWELYSISPPSNGSASFTADGTIRYEPNPGYSGTDIVNYTVQDSQGNLGRAKLSIQVQDPSPTQGSPFLSTGSAPIEFQLSKTTTSYKIPDQPGQGTLTLSAGNRLVYNPGNTSHADVTLHALRQDGDSIFTTESFRAIHTYDGQLARQLEGGTDSIQLLPSGHNLTVPFTLEAWIYPTAYGPVYARGYGRIFDKYAFSLFLCYQSPTSRGTPYYQDDSIALWLQTTGSGMRYLSTPKNSVRMGEWQHVALHMDAVGNVGMHLDGQPQELFVSGLSDPPAPPDANAEFPLYTGNSGSGDRGFYGKIDNLRYWDGVRTTAQIANYRHFPLSGDEPALHAYWPMNLETPSPLPTAYLTPVYTGTSATLPNVWQNLYLTDAYPIAKDWWASPVFGTIYTRNAPWLWTPNHQHLFLATPSEPIQPLWLYDRKLGWIWTDTSSYPWLWSDHFQTWFYYQEATTEPRSLYNPATKSWTTDQDLLQ